MMYISIGKEPNQYFICDEITEEKIAMFYNYQDATDYINWKTNKSTIHN